MGFAGEFWGVPGDQKESRRSWRRDSDWVRAESAISVGTGPFQEWLEDGRLGALTCQQPRLAVDARELDQFGNCKIPLGATRESPRACNPPDRRRGPRARLSVTEKRVSS